MIFLAQHCRIYCDHPSGCKESTEGRVIMLAGGGLAAQPPPAWTAALSREGGTGAPVLALCPTHKPEAQRVVRPFDG